MHQVKTASTKMLRNVIAEYEQSLRSHEIGEESSDNEYKDESSCSDEELEQALASELCSKGDRLFEDRCA